MGFAAALIAPNEPMKRFLRPMLVFYGSILLVCFLFGLVLELSFGRGFLMFFLGAPVASASLLAGAIIWIVRGRRQARIESPSAEGASLRSPRALSSSWRRSSSPGRSSRREASSATWRSS